MIRVRRGALVDSATEAILRPIRSDLTPLTPAGRDLEDAAGPTLREHLARIGDVPVGGAIITPGGALPGVFLIHAAIESHDEPVTRSGVERALTNGLRRALEWGVESLALPPLGSGAGQLELETVADLTLEAIRALAQEAATLAEIEVVVDSAYEEEAFSQRL